MKTITEMMMSQRGTTIVNNATMDVSIQEVDPNSAKVNITGFSIPYGGTNVGTANFSAQITSSTNLRIVTNYNATISWEVIG